jgi:hypothetical protein
MDPINPNIVFRSIAYSWFISTGVSVNTGSDFGTLINYRGMRKINTRGIESANKAMLMAAIAYNLKKWMKHHGGYRRLPAIAFQGHFTKDMLYLFLEAVKMKIRTSPEGYQSSI